MLVLSRKIQEEVLIGANIVVRVIKIHGNRVSLGVTADGKTRVLRGELAERGKPKGAA